VAFQAASLFISRPERDHAFYHILYHIIYHGSYHIFRHTSYHVFAHLIVILKPGHPSLN